MLRLSTRLLANTERRYGVVAIALHWLIAILILLLVALGIYMVRLPDAGFDRTKITLIVIHKEIGLLVLVLAGLRLVWRQLNPLPASNTPLNGSRSRPRSSISAFIR